jgi:hypothetical protein
MVRGRDPEPSAGIIDSPSVKAADTVGQDGCGYDQTDGSPWLRDQRVVGRRAEPGRFGPSRRQLPYAR